MTRAHWVMAGILLAMLGAIPAGADAVKENIYVLGIHIGNADGVLFGLTNSYDQRKEAHPAAATLIRRQLRWTSEVAGRLGLGTEDIDRLEKRLDGLTFAQMRSSVAVIVTRLRTDVGKKYNAKAGPIFSLGVQITAVQGVLRLIENVRSEERERWRSTLVSAAESADSNVRSNSLEVPQGVIADLVRKARSDPFSDVAGAADKAATDWQKEFGSAPAWSPSSLATPKAPSRRQPAPVQSTTRLSTPTHSGSTSHPGASAVVPSLRSGAPSNTVGNGNHGAPVALAVWSKTWKSDWGDMVLQASGGHVSGTFTWKKGTLEGDVSPDGRRITGQWTQQPTRKPPSDAGAFEFTLLGNGRSFSGHWWYGFDKTRKPSGNWTGTAK
jgi:hypothetical protein